MCNLARGRVTPPVMLLLLPRRPTPTPTPSPLPLPISHNHPFSPPISPLSPRFLFLASLSTRCLLFSLSPCSLLFKPLPPLLAHFFLVYLFSFLLSLIHLFSSPLFFVYILPSFLSPIHLFSSPFVSSLSTCFLLVIPYPPTLLPPFSFPLSPSLPFPSLSLQRPYDPSSSLPLWP